MNPIDYKIGQRVRVTDRTFKVMLDGNKSIKAYPSTDFIEKIKFYAGQGQEARVMNRFLPGYEMTIRFANGEFFHVKDNWIELVPGNAYNLALEVAWKMRVQIHANISESNKFDRDWLDSVCNSDAQSIERDIKRWASGLLAEMGKG